MFLKSFLGVFQYHVRDAEMGVPTADAETVGAKSVRIKSVLPNPWVRTIGKAIWNGLASRRIEDLQYVFAPLAKLNFETSSNLAGSILRLHPMISHMLTVVHRLVMMESILTN